MADLLRFFAFYVNILTFCADNMNVHFRVVQFFFWTDRFINDL